MPVMDFLVSMLGFFLFVAWFWVLVLVLSDIFSSDDMSGGRRAVWVLFVIGIPWLGVLIYIIVHGDAMITRGGGGMEPFKMA